MRILLLPLIALSLLTACSSTGSSTTDQQPEPESLRNQLSLQITYLDQYIQVLTSRANSIQVQGRALSESEMNFVEQVNKLRADYEHWEEKYEGAREGTLDGKPLDDALTTIQALVHRAAILEEQSVSQ
jgi:hypothetical protein